MDKNSKIKFLHSLPDEAFFRNEVLMPLFKKMPEYHSVLTHGTDEKGKDIVLIKKSPIKGYLYTALIVKNDAITNAAKAKEKELIANVSTQIVQTIDSGYDCILQKKHINFNEIIVVTSKNISNSARPEIISIAHRHRFLNIEFIVDEELVELLDKYLPDIYKIGKGNLSSYLASLRESCSAMNELKNIAIYKGGQKSLEDVYIEPSLGRIENVVGDTKITKRIHVDSIPAFISKSGNSVICAPVGAGKSTLLRYIITKKIHEFENGKSKEIPVFIRIKEFIGGYFSEQEIEKSVHAYLAFKLGITADDVANVFADRAHLVFYLDGLDELASGSEMEKFRKFLEHLSGQACKCIITTRDVIENVEKRFQGFTHYNLYGFNVRQIKRFFEKWFSKNQNRLFDILKDHNIIEKLPATPLVMTLLAIIYDNDQNTEIPSNLSELYKMFLDLLLGKWSIDRRLDSFHTANDKETYLTELAVYMHSNGNLTCNKGELLTVLDDTVTKLGREIDKERLINELIVNTGILVETDPGIYEFRHLSFQEFLVAEHFLLKRMDEILINNASDDWWSQVLYFYCGLRKDNEDILPRVLEKLTEENSLKKLLGLLDFGYLVQASYKTHAKRRKELIKKALVHFTESVPGHIAALRETIKNVPEVVFHLSMLYANTAHYSSKYLTQIFKEIQDELIAEGKGKDLSLPLMYNSHILLDQKEFDIFIDAEKHVESNPIAKLMHDHEIRHTLLEDGADKQQRQKARKLVKKVRTQVNENRKYFDKFLK